MINSVIIGLLVVVCVFSSELKNPKSTNDKISRIVGGHEVDIEKAPYTVSVQGCGGTIIHDKFILTAAHCTRYSINNGSSVRTESNYRNQGGNLVKIKKIIAHPLYSKFSWTDYDISILELEEKLNFTKKCQSIGLPRQNQNVEDGSLLYTYGWGVTQNPQEDSNKLRGVEVPKVSQSSCNASYTGKITDQMICAGYTEGGKDSCFGDSGGPLIFNGSLLVGVVSWGYGCARPNYPGVYARVASVRNWIDSVING
ncbi:hypothetical protein DMENIID0001_168790 [Sergentomyia squamirostris]